MRGSLDAVITAKDSQPLRTQDVLKLGGVHELLEAQLLSRFLVGPDVAPFDDDGVAGIVELLGLNDEGAIEIGRNLHEQVLHNGIRTLLSLTARLVRVPFCLTPLDARVHHAEHSGNIPPPECFVGFSNQLHVAQVRFRRFAVRQIETSLSAWPSDGFEGARGQDCSRQHVPLTCPSPRTTPHTRLPGENARKGTGPDHRITAPSVEGLRDPEDLTPADRRSKCSSIGRNGATSCAANTER